MTGVKNRNFFEDFVEKVQHVRTYCVAVLDIDRFKLINDTFGHAIGDKAIQCIAKQLSQWQPRHDIHIIRYGGDEFVILMPYAFDDMHAYIEQLHTKLMTTHCETKDGHVIPLSVSIGICYNDARMVSLNNVFQQADDALYAAKKTRGTFVYEQLRELSI